MRDRSTSILVILLFFGCDRSDGRNWTVASCNEVAAEIQQHCVSVSDQPCDVYKDAYEACREETKAGRWVKVPGVYLAYVPPEGWVDTQSQIADPPP